MTERRGRTRQSGKSLRMRAGVGRRAFVFLFLCVLTAGHAAFFSPARQPIVPAYGAEQPAEAVAPEIAAQAAALYCLNTEEVVFEKNGGQRMDPYSITKLLTALLAVEKEKDLDRQVTVSAAAAGQEGSTMELQEGEVVTVRDLLYGALILSGNDAAYALGETVSGGDVEQFVALMNERATKLGCKGTHFVNPSGVKEAEHYTTAEDYILIAKSALGDPRVKEIAGTKKYKMKATNKSEARTMKTHTDLMSDADSGVIAGKTGYWYGDATIVLEYEKKDLRLLLVLLGDEKKTRPTDAEALFAYGAQSVKGRTVVRAGKDKAWVMVRGGKHTLIRARAAEDAYIYPRKGDKVSVETRSVQKSGLRAPLKKGEEVGELKVYVNGKETASAPLVADRAVERGWLPSEIYLSNNGVLIAIAVLLLAAGGFAAYRYRKRKAESYLPKH